MTSDEATRRLDALRSRPNGGYPEDYRDPGYDGTTAGFAAVVLPARTEALERSLNDAFADLLPEGVKFEWVSDDA